MVVDSNEWDRDTLRDIAGSVKGMEWSGAYESAEEALSAMQIDTPELLVIAVELPEMNGLTLARRMQELHPKLQVIITAMSRHHATEAYEVGARGYIVKPFDKQNMIRLLEKVSDIGGARA